MRTTRMQLGHFAMRVIKKVTDHPVDRLLHRIEIDLQEEDSKVIF